MLPSSRKYCNTAYRKASLEQYTILSPLSFIRNSAGKLNPASRIVWTACTRHSDLYEYHPWVPVYPHRQPWYQVHCLKCGFLLISTVSHGTTCTVTNTIIHYDCEVTCADYRFQSPLGLRVLTTSHIAIGYLSALFLPSCT